MNIDNDTNQPVDYDVDIGPISMVDGGSGFGFSSPPRFRIAAGGKMYYELAYEGTLNHVFVIDDGTQTKTVIELNGAPSTNNVKLEATVASGKTYYRAQLVK